VNVGVRPTFGGGELLIEGHLLEFDEEIYGEELTLEFVEYLRPELKFDSVDDLIAQMRQDVSEAATILRTVPSRM
jgi:FAD synthase